VGEIVGESFNAFEVGVNGGRTESRHRRSMNEERHGRLSGPRRWLVNEKTYCETWTSEGPAIIHP
jgi:hypothetical protein